MESFHIITILIAFLVFLGLFIYSAIIFYSGKSKLFPPDMAPCPDGWKLNSDGTCKIPAPGPTANLGNLANTGNQIYVYDNTKGKSKYSFLPKYYDIVTDETYNQMQNKMQYYEQKYNEALIMARTEFVAPSFQQQKESILLRRHKFRRNYNIR
jgi:hypothetical protein